MSLKPNFTVYFEEFKGVAHLEALEMLSSQSSVKLEVQLLNHKTLINNRNSSLRLRLDRVDRLFNAEKLNDDYEFNDEEDDEEENLIKDFSQLINRNEEQFDIEQFESLVHDYASKKFYMRNILDKVVRSFKLALNACLEDFTVHEIVILFFSFSKKNKTVSTGLILNYLFILMI